jgi:hypothetical protein
MGRPFALRAGAGAGDFSRDVMMKVPQPPIGDVRGREAQAADGRRFIIQSDG